MLGVLCGMLLGAIGLPGRALPHLGQSPPCLAPGWHDRSMLKEAVLRHWHYLWPPRTRWLGWL